MRLNWNGGIYTGEEHGGVPNGKGVLALENGYMRGVWENGVMVLGSMYVGDTLYSGSFDENGRYHGQGYLVKEDVFEWHGQFEHGNPFSSSNGDSLPNCVFIGRYYGGIKPAHLSDDKFPHAGKIGRDGYTDVVKSDVYKMPRLSEKFGMEIVCAVEHHNNRWDYSKGYNNRALYFMVEDSEAIYTDAWVCKWENGDCAPLEPMLAFEINDYIHEELARADIEDFGKQKRMYSARTFTLLDEGIYKGDSERGRIVYNHDDAKGRLCYDGNVVSFIPNGYGELLYRPDAENHRYKGGFEDGLFHNPVNSRGSKATLIKQNGEDWYGTFIRGKFEGDNAIAIGGWAYERFDGKFVADKLVHGIHRDPERSYVYEGDFLNRLPHGFGKETIDGVSWEGHFANGKRLVGIGEGAVKNVVEIYDPYVAREVNFADFSELAFMTQMSAGKVEFLWNDKLREYTLKVGTRLTLAIAKDEGVPENELARRLFGVSATGSCIICGEGGKALSTTQMATLENLLKEDIAKLQREDKASTYELTLLKEDHSSEWNVTDETHDDYPLEADDDRVHKYFYLVKVGNARYYARYLVLESYPWTANDGDIDFVTADGSLELHRLPDTANSDVAAIEGYCALQHNWTTRSKGKRFEGKKKAYGKYKENGGFMAELISEIFGKNMKQK